VTSASRNDATRYEHPLELEDRKHRTTVNGRGASSARPAIGVATTASNANSRVMSGNVAANRARFIRVMPTSTRRRASERFLTS